MSVRFLRRKALTLLAVVLAASTALAAGTTPYRRVVIYYDDRPGTEYNYGKKYVNALRNLLGHFKTDVSYQNVDDYTPGALTTCDTAFYVGSYYRDVATRLPDAFLHDVAQATNTFVWVNYNIWELLWSTNDTSHLGLRYDGSADFGYDRVSYKGEELYKGTYYFGLVLVSPTNAVPRVHATAFSSTDPGLETRPYALNSSNFWYFADNCFDDDVDISRTLVFSDLLHDILDTGAPTNHRAIVRIEDLNPGYTDLDNLRNVSAYLSSRGIRASYGVIPHYLDPQGQELETSEPDVLISQDREFLVAVQDVLQQGGFILSHGYTHNNDEEDEISGEGYEFWHHGTNYPGRPLTNDSWRFALGRVDSSAEEFLTSAIRSHIWETPHYEASLVDYHAFAERHRFWYERLRPYNVFTEGLTSNEIESISADTNLTFQTQYTPYMSYRTVHGSVAIPENLNFYLPSFPDSYGKPMTVANKLMYGQKLKVVRDAVASFYFHTYQPTNKLAEIVDGLEAQGYTFTDVETLLSEEPVGREPPAAADNNTVLLVQGTPTNVAGDLVIGATGASNALAILDGGIVTGAEGAAGLRDGAHHNRATVSGGGSAWLNAGTLTIGAAGADSSLVITNGARVVSLDGMVGEFPSARRNRVTIDGAGSTWTNRRSLFFGYKSADNVLAIRHGGTLENTDGNVGETVQADRNRVVVEGPGSEWDNRGPLVLGHRGAHNALVVTNGGHATGTFALIGVGTTSCSNSVLLSGSGTGWDTGSNLVIGVNGPGNALTVENGARAGCGGARLGEYAYGSGNAVLVTGSGSLWNVGGGLVVGVQGSDNELTVADDGMVAAAHMTIGSMTGSVGNVVRVTGGHLAVTGVLEVARGSLELAGGTAAAGALTIGERGTATVSGDVDATGIRSVTNRGALTVNDTALSLAGDLYTDSTNTAIDLRTASIEFSGGIAHDLRTGSQDLLATMQGFTNNRAIGQLILQDTVDVTGVVYVWSLAGTGVLDLAAGTRFYYAHADDWHGTVMLTGDAVFERVIPPYVTIEASAGAHGHVVPSGSIQIPYGSDTNVLVTPDPHHHVTDVTVDGVSIGPVDQYAFTGVTNNRSIHAEFAIDRHTWSVVSAHGSPNPPAGLYTNDYGTVITNSVTSPETAGATQAVCLGWTGTGSLADGTGTMVTFALTNDSSVAWNWKTQFVLTATSGDHGSVTTANGWYDAGTTGVTVTAVADTGYHFTGWSGDVPSGLETANPLTLTIDQARTLSAGFAINMYTITAIADSGGNVAPSGSIQVPYGSDTNVLVTPDPHHHVTDVTVDGVSIGPVDQYAFTGVTNNRSIHAEFAIDRHTWSVVSAHGSPNPPAGLYTNDYGTVITNSVTSPETAGTTQAVCLGWTGAGSVGDGTGTTVTFTLTNDSAIAWNWKTQFVLTATSGDHGSVTTANGWYDAGTTGVTVTAVADTGYHFTGWSGDVPSGLETANPLTLTIDQARTLSAGFAINMYTITAIADSGGNVAPSGSIQVPYGSGTNVLVIPDPHHHVTDVTVDGVSIGPVDQYAFTGVTNNRSIHAEFAIDRHTWSVVSAHGSPNPPAGLYTNDYGTVITNSVTSPETAGATQAVCLGWTGTGSLADGTGTMVTFALTNDSSVAWNWKTQFMLTATSGDHGSVTADNGWHDAGTTGVTVTAVARPCHRFAYWTGDVPPGKTHANPLLLTMDRARNIAARFALGLPWPDGGVILTNRRPEFAWALVDQATWYHIWINRNGTLYHHEWLNPSGCTWIPPFDLQGGQYTWWVRAWGETAGYGDWSGAAEFEVSVMVPGKSAPITPAGTAVTARPEFTWQAVPYATWYRLWVSRAGAPVLQQWVEGQTNYLPEIDLPLGDYTWWVRTYSPDGYGPWSDPMRFVYGLSSPLNPTGIVTATRRPVFSWEPVDGATWYRLWIERDGEAYGTRIVSGTEHWNPDADLPYGEYRWWIRSGNETAYSPWSSPAVFQIGTARPLEPAGLLFVPPTRLTWGVSGCVEATSYHLWISRDGEAHWASWVPVAETSQVAGPARVYDLPVLLTPGSYEWWVRTHHSSGYGAWSPGQTFTVDPN